MSARLYVRSYLLNNLAYFEKIYTKNVYWANVWAREKLLENVNKSTPFLVKNSQKSQTTFLLKFLFLRVNHLPYSEI